jgi:hypothetical protein
MTHPPFDSLYMGMYLASSIRQVSVGSHSADLKKHWVRRFSAFAIAIMQ